MFPFLTRICLSWDHAYWVSGLGAPISRLFLAPSRNKYIVKLHLTLIRFRASGYPSHGTRISWKKASSWAITILTVSHYVPDTGEDFGVFLFPRLICGRQHMTRAGASASTDFRISQLWPCPPGSRAVASVQCGDSSRSMICFALHFSRSFTLYQL